MPMPPSSSDSAGNGKAAIVGFAEGFEGTDLRGWAVSARRARPVITVRDPAGRTVAKASTGEARPDVAQLGHGPDCGFRIPIRRKSETLLHVFADDFELLGSPLVFGPGHYDGVLELAGATASGWVSERCERFTGALVELRDQDGNLLGAAEAACDPEAAGPQAWQARFSTPLAYPAFGRADLAVRAYVGETRFAEAQAALRLDGYLDLLNAEQAGGWLICPEAPDLPLEIEVFRDGARVGSGRCQLPRDDVRGRYPDNWRVGFHIRLAPPAVEPAADAAQTYSFRLAGTEIELFDGPFVVEDREWAIAAARRIGRWGRQDASLGEIDRTVLQRALAGYLSQRRFSTERPRRMLAAPASAAGGRRRLNIVIPIYRDVEVTRACIASVLATRDAADAVILVNDASPDPGMDVMLQDFASRPDVYLLTNPENRGFVRSANRGMAFCRRGDVLLLNSDTRVFPGVLDELCAVARSAPDIGTVTALSNNATIFSYPHKELPRAGIADASWEQIAALAQAANRGVAIDVPTGHGFCLLIRREVLARVGVFDEGYGRGYGEENDFCQRAADLGFRNVAAAGAFVEHRESVSFSEDRQRLTADNLRRLGGVYPEYHATIMGFERAEGLRRARWPLDAARLRAAGTAGAEFVLLVTNWLAGGARRAVDDIEREVGYGPGRRRLTLTARPTGLMELEADDPLLRAVFGPEDCAALFDLLASARVTLVLAHQVLGFPPEFAEHFAAWVRGRRALYYAHDYYPICPRVTMIDAAGAFCDAAPPEVCTRCAAAAGAHEAARLPAALVPEHRARMGRLLRAFTAVVAPSQSAAGYYRGVWPEVNAVVAPHPEPAMTAAPSRRQALPPAGTSEVLLLGALGPHKGSARLLEIARRARLTHPELNFRVIGHTDIDADLRALGNIVITGGYQPAELPRLVAESAGWVALFLHLWPETWSYTLTEAARFGLVPLVPDLGAPAERVRAVGRH